MNTRLSDFELKRRTRLFLEWSAPFFEQKVRIMNLTFKGYRIANGSVVETIYSDIGKQAMNDIDSVIQAKAKELNLNQ